MYMYCLFVCVCVVNIPFTPVIAEKVRRLCGSGAFTSVYSIYEQ